MVKKLIKYEMKAYAHTLLPIELILLGVALLLRFIQLFESSSFAYGAVFVASVISLVVGVFVCLIMTFAVGLRRFYSNLFTGEGYLSFTLPVSPTAHIFSKLLVAFIWMLISLATIVMSLSVATAGEVFAEIMKAFVYVADKYFELFGVHGAFFIAEAIIVFFAVSLAKYLCCYMAVSVGQTAHKNRVLAAFGVYFGWYFIRQILGTILIIVIAEVSDTGFFSEIGDFVSAHPYASVHMGLCGLAVFYVVVSGAYFLVTRYMISKKLNLE